MTAMSARKTDRADTMLFDLPLDALGLPKRAVNALRAGGITSFAEIVEWPERELRALPNCGQATMSALRGIAERAGVKFGRQVVSERKNQ
jgi:DNA-directed RNA polymerase alpha subunit